MLHHVVWYKFTDVSEVLAACINRAMSELKFVCTVDEKWAGVLSQYSVWLQTGRLGFDPQQRQMILPLALCIQTSGEAHPACYPMGTGGIFRGVKQSQGVILTTHPHLVSSSTMGRSYTIFPPCQMHGSSRTALLLLFLIRRVKFYIWDLKVSSLHILTQTVWMMDTLTQQSDMK
jgi:hypothetical protein